MRGSNRFLRHVICTFLVVAMLFAALPASARVSAAQEADFTPVLRFVVTSDVHIRNDTAALNGHEQLAKLYETAYAYSESHPVYDKLDAMFFIGDNTQTGSEQQQTYFFNYLKENTKEGTYALAAMGNHEFKATGQNYNDPEGATAKFLEYSGYETTDTRFELGGYQFIVFAPDRYNKSKYLFFTEEKLQWLRKELDAAVAETPDKPIFVLQHQPPYATMKGSYGTSGDKGLKEVLKDYPQVIDFSGHTHCTLSDPRIIWQDEFTAINTGGLAYLSVPVMNGTNDQAGGRAIDEEGGWIGESEDSAVRNAGMYYIVEVDKNDTVRVQIYNMFTESLWGEPFILDSIDPKDFVYTDDRSKAAVQPEFAADAQLQLVTDNYKNLQFTIPQATCKDVVQSYRVEVYQGSTLKQTLYRLSGANYGDAAPERVKAYVKDLAPNTGYTIKVYATSSYNLDSKPLTMQVTTCGENTGVKADVLDVIFQADGTAINTVNGEALTTYGEPSVYYDSELKKNVAVFDGKDDAYGFWGISNWYDVISSNYTLETYAFLEKKPESGSMGILANLQSASIGFTYANDGKVYLYSRLNSSAYTKPGVVVEDGSWIHITGTYDGQSLKFYINGVLMAEQEVTGTLVVPAFMARCMYLGADCNVDARESMFLGKIASAKLYTQALTEEQVAQQYQLSLAQPDGICPEHGGQTWTPVEAATWAEGGAIASGHYVLTQDIAVADTLTVAADQQVCIDLAGFDITASGAATGADTWYRVFENSGILTILDTADVDGVISGGTVWDNVEYARGGNIYNGANSTFNLYDGVISGGIASGSADEKVSGSFGGNLYGAEGSTINIYGGRIENGTATKQAAYSSKYLYGGNIGSVGVVQISGGTVIGGAVTNTFTDTKSSYNLSLYGGNIAVRDGGALYISGGMVLDGVLSGTRTNTSSTCKAYGRGGNIAAYGADITITGGVISGGKIQVTAEGKATGTTVPASANAFGGNVYIAAGALNIRGGSIVGGLLDSIAKPASTNTSTGKAKVTANGGSMYITEGVVATITGGTITGGQAKHNSNAVSTETMGGNIFVANTGVVKISGGTVRDGYSYYRGGNIGLNDGSVVELSGNAVISGGTVNDHSVNCNGENIVVMSETSRLSISGNAQVQKSGNRASIFAITSGKIQISGGKVTGGVMLGAASASSANAGFAMYGGTVDDLEKSSYVSDANIRIYNGVLQQAPEAWLAECSCYTKSGNSTYTVWHTQATDGSCAVCAYNYGENNVTMYTGKHAYAATQTAGTAACHCGHSETGVVAILNQEIYSTLNQALAAAKQGDQVQLVQDTAEQAVTTVGLTLDLNGYDIQGDVTAQGNVIFIKDSQTDDYTVEDAAGYGMITGNIQGAIPAEGYVAVAGTSYHKLTQCIETLSLRPGVAGMYYGATWKCDEVLAQQVASYGVALSTQEVPGSDFAANANVLYTQKDGQSFTVKQQSTSVLVENILAAGQDNDTRGKTPVYAASYVTFADGRTVMGREVGCSLYDLLKQVDSYAYAENADAVEAFYKTWETPLSGWGFANIGK